MGGGRGGGVGSCRREKGDLNIKETLLPFTIPRRICAPIIEDVRVKAK